MSSLTPIRQLPSPVQVYLARLHARLIDRQDGNVATYIPELAKADPVWFGIVVATVDGHVYEVGATRQQFTIQSISKPLRTAWRSRIAGPRACAKPSASNRAATRSIRSVCSRTAAGR